eukprot:g1551.t1
MKDSELRRLLILYYKSYCPTKLSNVDEIVTKYSSSLEKTSKLYDTTLTEWSSEAPNQSSSNNGIIVRLTKRQHKLWKAISRKYGMQSVTNVLQRAIPDDTAKQSLNQIAHSRTTKSTNRKGKHSLSPLSSSDVSKKIQDIPTLSDPERKLFTELFLARYHNKRINKETSSTTKDIKENDGKSDSNKNNYSDSARASDKDANVMQEEISSSNTLLDIFSPNFCPTTALRVGSSTNSNSPGVKLPVNVLPLDNVDKCRVLLPRTDPNFAYRTIGKRHQPSPKEKVNNLDNTSSKISTTKLNRTVYKNRDDLPPPPPPGVPPESARVHDTNCAIYQLAHSFGPSKYNIGPKRISPFQWLKKIFSDQKRIRVRVRRWSGTRSRTSGGAHASGKCASGSGGEISSDYKLTSSKGYDLCVSQRPVCNWGECEGRLKGFDKHFNLLLTDVTEKFRIILPWDEWTRTYSGGGARGTHNKRKYIGTGQNEMQHKLLRRLYGNKSKGHLTDLALVETRRYIPQLFIWGGNIIVILESIS